MGSRCVCVAVFVAVFVAVTSVDRKVAGTALIQGEKH